MTKWDEFEQHEQSLEQRQQAEMAAMTTGMVPMPPMMTGMPTMPYMAPGVSQQWMMPPVMPPGAMVPPPGVVPFELRPDAVPQYEAWYPADTERAQPQQRAPVVSSSTPNLGGAATGDVRFSNRTTASMMSVNQLHTVYVPSPVPPGYRFAPYMPRTSELVRRPIHVTPVNANATASESVDKFSRLKSCVMSALGMQRSTTTQPRGLVNDRQNLCFMNSVLQCLLRSPGLVGTLHQDAGTSARETSLLRCIVELMQKLNVNVDSSSNVDTAALRRAASVLPCSMVVAPSRPQVQQDAAEFLMWLLSVLHNALNTGGRGETGNQGASFIGEYQM